MHIMFNPSKATEEIEKNPNEREKWSRKAEYVLSLIGYLVGLGNLWRFPYICMRNGGGAFLIPYVFFLVCCGIPLFFLENVIGQFSGKGLWHVWEVCPIFKGIGVGMMIPLIVLNVYYNMIIAWTLYYIGNSFISPLPWTTCTNEWNSPNCAADRNIGHNISSKKWTPVNNNSLQPEYLTQNATAEIDRKSEYKTLDFLPKNASVWVTGQEEFWQQNVLEYSSGIEELGHVNWHLVLCLIGAWFIVGLCIMKGVKSVGKVVYVTATLPYILLTIILIKGLTLDGSVNGVSVYLQPNFRRLLDIQVWTEAALQVFYSLGPGWGPLISMASFNKFQNNCIRMDISLQRFRTAVCVRRGNQFIFWTGYIYSSWIHGNKTITTIGQNVKSGPGLGFIAYPEALAHLPGANFWSCLFFIMLLTVGLDSQFVCCEAIIGAFTDSFQILRRRRLLFLIAYCIINFILGLVFCSQGGIYVFQLVDWYVAAFALPIFGLLECIIFAWIYGGNPLCCSFGELTGVNHIFCDSNAKSDCNKVVPLKSCSKPIESHCRRFHINFKDVNNEADLLKYRGGLFDIPTEQCTICPNHRYRLGLGWRSSQLCMLNYCSKGKETKKRKKPLLKGTIALYQFIYLWKQKQQLVQIGSGVRSFCRKEIVQEL